MNILKKKKGAIEVQLNWVFILVVGAVILIFFVFLSKGITKSSEVKTSEKILSNVDAILAGTSTTSKSSNLIEIPRTDLTYTCFAGNACSPNYGCTSEFEYTKTGKTIDMSSRVVFSPETINSDFLILWTQDWSIPFRVTNFMFLSRPDIKYILVAQSDNALANKVQELMEENEFLKKNIIRSNDAVTLSSLNINQNDYWIRIIYFNPASVGSTTPSIPPAAPATIKAGHVDSIVVSESVSAPESGNVAFHDFKSVQSYPQQTYPFIDVLSLVGAVFSEVPEHYNCNMNKALFRYHKVHDVIKERTLSYLIPETNPTTNPVKGNCNYFYTAITFNEIIESPHLLNQNFINYLENLKQELEAQNTNALLGSCPRLY